jgi:O-antigen/teichoic acid export membrane protein
VSPLRQFIVYGVGGAASRLAAIFLVPLYTRTLDVEDYGRLELALAVHMGVVLLAGLQVESAVARDMHAARAEGQRAAMARAALVLTCIGAAAALVVIAAVAAAGWATRWLDARALWMLALMTLPTQWFGVQLVMLRFEGRALRYAALSLLDLLLTAGFSVWFMVVMGWGVTGGLAGILAAKTLCVLLAWRETLGADRPPAAAPPKATAVAWRQRLLEYGLPALPAVLVAWAQNAGGRVFAAAALSLHDLAIAALGLKVAALFGFVIYSLRLAWEPHAMARLERHAAEPLYYRRALEFYLVGMLPLLGAAVALVPWAVRALAPAAYTSAVAVAVVAVVAQYWTGVANMTVIGIQGARRMNRMFPVFAWGAAVNVVLLFVLAPVAGALAAAIGLLAGAMCSALLAAHVSDELFETQFGKRLPAVALVGSVLLAAVPGCVPWAQGVPAGALATISWLAMASALAAAVTVLVAVAGLGRHRAREMGCEARSALATLRVRLRRGARRNGSESRHG